MKYLKPLALGAALTALLSAGSVQAAESAAGGLEFSGNVTIVTGWQHDDGATIDFGSCSLGVGVIGCNDADSALSGTGGLGDFRGLGLPNRDTFNFYVDEVELDLQKSFGENIRIRADLDFGRFLSGTPNIGGANSIIEQAYVTANIPVGNGAEFLIGRFNAPIGYEAVDRINNVAISFSNIYRYIRPHNLTGAKLYYAFSDKFDWNVYLVNNLADTFSFAAGTDSAIPSWGTRFGFTFGEEGQESTLGLSYAGGPEAFGNNAHLTHIFDLDFMLRVTEKFLLAGEIAYRQDNTGYIPYTGAPSLLGINNQKVWGGNLLMDYAPSESWDFWFRYDYIHDINFLGSHTGMNEQVNGFTVGAGYEIIEDAKFKIEYRLDWRHYAATGAATYAPLVGADGDTNSTSNSIAAEFAYQF